MARFIQYVKPTAFEWITIIISTAALISGSYSLYMSYESQRTALEANIIAKRSLATAEDANKISSRSAAAAEQSNTLSLEANRISKGFSEASEDNIGFDCETTRSKFVYMKETSDLVLMIVWKVAISNISSSTVNLSSINYSIIDGQTDVGNVTLVPEDFKIQADYDGRATHVAIEPGKTKTFSMRQDVFAPDLIKPYRSIVLGRDASSSYYLMTVNDKLHPILDNLREIHLKMDIITAKNKRLISFCSLVDTRSTRYDMRFLPISRD